MRERDEILALWEQVGAAEGAAVLATVMKTEGSSYRLPGARLLLTQSGRHAGAVSGGCLEDDILKKAWWLTAHGPVLRRYDTTPDGEFTTDGYGLGCNGVIHVLLERVTRSAPSTLSLLREVRDSRRPVTVAHVLAPANAVGQRAIVSDEGAGLSLSGAEVFLERIEPPVRLLIFGAGYDAVPVTQFAKSLGWRVEVYDGRAHYAKVDKFPQADRVAVRLPGAPTPEIDEWTAAVVMTHSFSQDADVLRSLVDLPLRYLGVLGPRKRTGELLEETGLRDSLAQPMLHAPMGLDIGADGPEQVALAIVAEIQSVMHGRPAGLLRDHPGPIHHADPSFDETKGKERAWVRSIVCA